MQMINKYKQYGFFNFFKRILLSLLSRMGISINKWLFCTQKINETKLIEIKIDEVFQVIEMNLDDFKKTYLFDSTKLSSFQQRFESSYFKAYGVYKNDNLAYYCWVSLQEFRFSKNLYSMKLNVSQGLLFDAFCFPKYRGNKLHNYMNIFRLKKLFEYGKSEAVVVLLNHNEPARRSQKRAGFICNKSITTYTLFGRNKIVIKNKKINL